MNNDKFFEHSLTRTKRAFASQGQGKEEEKQERKIFKKIKKLVDFFFHFFQKYRLKTNQ